MSGRQRIVPTSVEELASVLATHHRDRRPLAVEGGNTLRGMLPPDHESDTLVTTALAGVLAFAPDDLAVAAQAGISLRALGATLAQRGQFIPFDAPQRADATLGGTLAAGWNGPRRHRYGRPRDFVMGTTIVLADGTVAAAGGMVPKNVSGYDMSKLYVGSCGTLGVLVRANLKTLPLAQRSRAFIAPLPEYTRERAIARLRESPVEPAAALWIEGFHKEIEGTDGPEGRLFLLIEGSDSFVERASRDVRTEMGKAGVPETYVVDGAVTERFERVIDALAATIGERSVTYRVSGDPAAIGTRASRMLDVAARCEMRGEAIGDVMNGDVYVRCTDADTRSFAAKAPMLDDAMHDDEPAARIVACDHPVRAKLNVWGQPPGTLDLMRRVKAHFDPAGILNPHRYVGAI